MWSNGEHSPIAGGSENTFGNQNGCFSENWGLIYHSWVYIPRGCTPSQQKCPTTKEWEKKMWFIYTTQLLKNNIMKFVGKWMELGKKIIPSEVTQTQKDKHGMYSLVSGY